MEGKSNFKVNAELSSLRLNVGESRDSKYICKTCLELLRKRRKHIEETRRIEKQLEQSFVAAVQIQTPQAGLKRAANEGIEDTTGTSKKVREESTLATTPTKTTLVPESSTPLRPRESLQCALSPIPVAEGGT